jgi:hypothetical protein
MGNSKVDAPGVTALEERATGRATHEVRIGKRPSTPCASRCDERIANEAVTALARIAVRREPCRVAHGSNSARALVHKTTQLGRR